MAEEITTPEVDENGQPIVTPNGGEDAGSASETGAEGAEGAEVIENDSIDEDPEVPVRSNAAQIIARKNRQIEKLRSREAEGQGDEEDDDSQPITHRDLKPIIDNMAQSADESDLKELFSSTPDAKRYEKAIRKYMDHQGWKAVPPVAIYRHLAFENASKIGAKKREVADKEAIENRVVGTSHRPADNANGNMPSAEDIANMSDEEFEALQQKARTGSFI